MQQKELDELLTKAKELLKEEMTQISYDTWIKEIEIQCEFLFLDPNYYSKTFKKCIIVLLCSIKLL